MTTTCLWSKFIKIGVYKKVISNFKLYPNLRVCAAECFIITAALLDLCYKNTISWVAEYYPEWISYSGGHQTFNISDDFNREERLKIDLEELIQWIIWKELDKPTFNIAINDCDFIYRNYLERLKKLNRTHNLTIINKINRLIDEITINMSPSYKEKIYRELKI